MMELQAQVAAAEEEEFTVAQIVTQLSVSLRVPEELMPYLLALPSTAGGFQNLDAGAQGLNAWRSQLARGLLPQSSLGWPGDAVFRDALLGTLAELDMGKFTRRHPALLNVLLKNVLEVLGRYEQERKEIPGPDAAEGQENNSGKKQQGKGEKSSR